MAVNVGFTMESRLVGGFRFDVNRFGSRHTLWVESLPFVGRCGNGVHIEIVLSRMVLLHLSNLCGDRHPGFSELSSHGEQRAERQV